MRIQDALSHPNYLPLPQANWMPKRGPTRLGLAFGAFGGWAGFPKPETLKPKPPLGEGRLLVQGRFQPQKEVRESGGVGLYNNHP